MPGGSKLSTFVCGGAAVLIGGFYALWGLGFIPLRPHAGDAPPWVAVCVGVTFAAGGLAAMLTLLPGPTARRAGNVLAFVILSGFAMIAGWIALAPGHRAISSPLMVFGPKVGDVGGRIMVGLGGIICILVAVLAARSALQAPTSKT